MITDQLVYSEHQNHKLMDPTTCSEIEQLSEINKQLHRSCVEKDKKIMRLTTENVILQKDLAEKDEDIAEKDREMIKTNTILSYCRDQLHEKNNLIAKNENIISQLKSKLGNILSTSTSLSPSLPPLITLQPEFISRYPFIVVSLADSIRFDKIFTAYKKHRGIARSRDITVDSVISEITECLQKQMHPELFKLISRPPLFHGFKLI